MKKINMNLKLLILKGLLLVTLNATAGDLIKRQGFEVLNMWSSPDTWPDKTVPQAGDDVVIPAGQDVFLDTHTAALNSLVIEGTLTAISSVAVGITSNHIMVAGILEIGSTGKPHPDAVITLTSSTADEEPSTRGLMVMNGTLTLVGTQNRQQWTYINQHINPGDSIIHVETASGWVVGDLIAIAPTDFFGIDETTEHRIIDINGGQITVDPAIPDFRWGRLQYINADGISLDNHQNINTPNSQEFTPTVLDERATVVNLTRSIVIQGDEDTLWENQGYGGHLMVMGLGSRIEINAVEFKRMGQAGVMGRYPVHWHVLSYDSNGQLLGQTEGQSIRNSSIHHSSNRCITIHGTNGLLVENNSCYDILGHAIFFEDAVERDNVVTGNVVMKVRNPTDANALKLHDTGSGGGGSSGIWASNPDNTITNNILVDAQGFGLWMAFPMQPVGLNHQVPIFPFRMKFGDFNNNRMHGNLRRGVMFDNAEIDDLGTVRAVQYASTTDDGQDGGYDGLERFVISGWQLFKNNGGNFWDRVMAPTFQEFVSADSAGKYFAGSGFEGRITRSLLVGKSLNNMNDSPSTWMGPPTALATYHSTFDMTDNIIAHFAYHEGQTSGAYATDDYYIRAVEKGQIRNVNNLMIDSHPGYRSDAAVNENIAFNHAGGYDHFVFASALWDPHGYWGSSMNYNVYDRPFLTHGAQCQAILPMDQNVASCDGEYFGIDQFILNDVNSLDLMALHVNRFADNDSNQLIGTWDVAGAEPDWVLPHMRHFATRNNGIYELLFPENSSPEDVSMRIMNMHLPDQKFTIGIEFSGNHQAKVFATTRYYYSQFGNDDFASEPSSATKHNYQALDSLLAVNNSNGETYWQDIGNNLVWVKVSYADLEQFFMPDPADPLSDTALYNTFILRVWSDN